MKIYRTIHTAIDTTLQILINSVKAYYVVTIRTSILSGYYLPEKLHFTLEAWLIIRLVNLYVVAIYF
ncbi:MAG: hypothetical protein ACR5K4_03010 [Sodalis sp. (in: enterobacteria)]